MAVFFVIVTSLGKKNKRKGVDLGEKLCLLNFGFTSSFVVVRIYSSLFASVIFMFAAVRGHMLYVLLEPRESNGL